MFFSNNSVWRKERRLAFFLRIFDTNSLSWVSDTAWKMSKYGVISGPYFPVFIPNIRKYGPEITPYLDTFYAVWVFSNSKIDVEWCFQEYKNKSTWKYILMLDIVIKYVTGKGLEPTTFKFVNKHSSSLTKWLSACLLSK